MPTSPDWGSVGYGIPPRSPFFKLGMIMGYKGKRRMTSWWKFWARTTEKTAPQGGWEGHPCQLPDIGVGITHEGLVWQCPKCHRRWHLTEIDYEARPRANYWTEVLSAAPISDEEFESLLEGDD